MSDPVTALLDSPEPSVAIACGACAGDDRPSPRCAPCAGDTQLRTARLLLSERTPREIPIIPTPNGWRALVLVTLADLAYPPAMKG